MLELRAVCGVRRRRRRRPGQGSRSGNSGPTPNPSEKELDEWLNENGPHVRQTHGAILRGETPPALVHYDYEDDLSGFTEIAAPSGEDAGAAAKRQAHNLKVRQLQKANATRKATLQAGMLEARNVLAQALTDHGITRPRRHGSSAGWLVDCRVDSASQELGKPAACARTLRRLWECVRLRSAAECRESHVAGAGRARVARRRS